MARHEGLLAGLEVLAHQALCEAERGTTTHPAANSTVPTSSMLDAMGDHEYYCASYASKEQPHMEGLLHTLIDGLRRKEAEITEFRAVGQDITPQEMARKFCIASFLVRIGACTRVFQKR